MLQMEEFKAKFFDSPEKLLELVQNKIGAHIAVRDSSGHWTHAIFYGRSLVDNEFSVMEQFEDTPVPHKFSDLMLDKRSFAWIEYFPASQVPMSKDDPVFQKVKTYLEET